MLVTVYGDDQTNCDVYLRDFSDWLVFSSGVFLRKGPARAPFPSSTQRGKVVWYVRLGRGPRTRIRAEFGTPEFDAEYQAALFRRAAEFVDKILHGTKPADLPVEQPTKFDLHRQSARFDDSRTVSAACKRGDRINRPCPLLALSDIPVAPHMSAFGGKADMARVP
jgi:hypothetical protein